VKLSFCNQEFTGEIRRSMGTVIDSVYASQSKIMYANSFHIQIQMVLWQSENLIVNARCGIIDTERKSLGLIGLSRYAWIGFSLFDLAISPIGLYSYIGLARSYS
jgi:hypothetical protein